MSGKCTVAIIQARPVYYDLAATVEKARGLVEEAARRGGQLIVFGETFFPGYPVWLDICPGAALWGRESTRSVFAKLYRNSVPIPGPEIDLFLAQAKKFGVALVLSVNERVESGPGSGTIYNTLITIDSDGEMLNVHRKLMPTYTERLVWGQGDGSGLRSVKTALGRVGALTCWEHWMPLARQALHDDGEAIHVAVWPTVNEIHQLASKHYAFEGGCFVLAAGSILSAADLPEVLDLPEALAADPAQMVMRGGSAIIGPDGRYICDPVFDEEVIVVAELDLEETVKQKMALDVSGHYARPDVFEFRRRQE